MGWESQNEKNYFAIKNKVVGFKEEKQWDEISCEVSDKIKDTLEVSNKQKKNPSKEEESSKK
jgi:hypothetical protein